MTLSTTSPGDEREAFETWRKSMHNGYNAWDAWQAGRASSSTVQQVGAEPLTAEQVVAQTMNYSMHEASIFFAGVIFAEEHHGIISPKSEQGDQQ